MGVFFFILGAIAFLIGVGILPEKVAQFLTGTVLILWGLYLMGVYTVTSISFPIKF